MRSPNDPGDVRKHQCAACPKQIHRGKLCHDCQEKMMQRREELREDDE